MTTTEWSKGFLELVFGDKFDWESQHFKNTPRRFVQMLRDMTTVDEFEFTTFAARTDEMVIIKDIPFHSLCAHHIVPFIGYCHIAYVPNRKIAGLSKFVRLVKQMSATLTVQEELTQDIAHFLESELDAKGVAVIMEAEHMCMTLRGVETHDSKTATSCMLGVFADHTRLARQEFLTLIANRKGQ